MAETLRKVDPAELAKAEEAQKASDEQRMVMLRALALSLDAKRKTAIDYRQGCGVESVWDEDEDAFDGIDDLNRATEAAIGRRRWLKPASSSGVLTEQRVSGNRCILLPNITGPYVESAAASIADMLLPLDDWPFGLDPTPIPELVGATEFMGKVPDGAGVNVPGHGTVTAAMLKKRLDDEVEKGKKCAGKAEKRIQDWLTECQWHGKARRQIDDAARVGTGITKGPIPAVKKQYHWAEKDGVQVLTILEETKPVTEVVDYWNLYPDPSCGESIHNGSYVWERAEITAKTLQDLRGTPGYIDSEIEECLREGPQSFQVSDEKRNPSESSLFEIWYFHGNLIRSDLEAAGCDCSSQDEHYISVPAVITMVNARIIKASLNILDKGQFPYDVLTWRRRPGMPWGQGVARQIRPCQQAITGAFRALMENAGLSAKPMLAVIRKYLEPTDGTWDLFGGKVFEVTPDADMQDVKRAITTLNIDSKQQELLAIINFNKQLADDITGAPLLLQGQMGKVPDTVGALQIINANVSVTKRRIARQFDDQVIEPSIHRYYDYLMQYGKDEEEKGLFIVNARSSSVLVERDMQNKNMITMLQVGAGNPAYRMAPEKAFAETAKAMKINPELIQYSDVEWEKKQKEMQGPPPDPRIQVEDMREKHEAQLTKMKQEFEMAQNEKDRENERVVAAINERLQVAELTSEERQNLEKIKASIGVKSMELDVQQKVTRQNQLLDLHKYDNDRKADVIKTPAMEPPGRAPVGQAFAK